MFVLGRPGNDLLSRVLRHSTIGAEAFNGRVREGIGFLGPRLDHRTGEGQGKQGKGVRSWVVRREPFHDARSHDFTKHAFTKHASHPSVFSAAPFCTDIEHKSDQAGRAISTSQLNALPRLHIWPIDVVVFHGSSGSSRFKVGFPLRCLQRLSRPYIATLHCGWRHNSSTRGTSIPVLSY